MPVLTLHALHLITNSSLELPLHL